MLIQFKQGRILFASSFNYDIYYSYFMPFYICIVSNHPKIWAEKKSKQDVSFWPTIDRKNADVIIGHASRIICSSVLFCRPHIQIRIWKAYFYSGMLRLEICAEHTSRHCWGLTNLTFGSIEKALKMDTKFLSYWNLSNNERCDCTTHIHVITFNTRIALFGNAFWVHFVTPTS